MKLETSSPKPIIISSFTCSVMAVLLIASVPIVFAMNGKGRVGSQSLETERRAEDLFQEAMTLSATKERELARARLLEAVRLWVQAREQEKAARACLQLGDYYKQGKKYQQALYYYNYALVEIKPLSRSVKAIALNSVAQVYAELIHNDLAMRYYREAGSQARAANDISTQVAVLSGQADIHYQQDELDQAIACIAQARQLNRKQDNEPEADLAYLSGRIDQKKGLTEQARGDFEESLAIYRRIGNEAGQVKVLSSISNLYLSSDQKQLAQEPARQAMELAEQQARQAITIAEKLRARDLRWRAWLSHARAQRAAGQKEAAIKSFKLAIHHMEGIFWSVSITTEASAIAFREECQAPYRELADLLIEQGQLDEAYDAEQSARWRAMLTMIAARRGTQSSKKGEQDDALREQLRSIARLRAQLLSSQHSPEQQAKLQKEISDAEYAMKEKSLKVEMARAGDRQVSWSQPASIKKLQESMAPENYLMVDFFLGENRSFAWLISPKDVSLEVLPGRNEIEKAVRQFIELVSVAPNNLRIESDISKLRERAGRLFTILFGRSSEQIIAGQKLIVVPDGLLHYLPFEALVHNGRFLVEEHEVSYFPSASLLLPRQGPSGKIETEDKEELIAFGDPIFSPRLKAPSRKGSNVSPNSLARQMRAYRGFNLAPVPRTRDEVLHITSLFPDRKQSRLGKDCTEKAVKQESLRRYRRLHFATHSLIDERLPSRSAIVLTLNDDPEEDGFLEAGEIAELDLDCDLVVLSACQTGRGQLLSGEGILGLSRSFLYAGARSVVVSLWSVSDISTGQLMKNFYQHIISNASNAAALRAAKLQMLEGGRETRHPYYWAPFIIVGKA